MICAGLVDGLLALLARRRLGALAGLGDQAVGLLVGLGRSWTASSPRPAARSVRDLLEVGLALGDAARRSSSIAMIGPKANFFRIR